MVFERKDSELLQRASGVYGSDVGVAVDSLWADWSERASARQVCRRPTSWDEIAVSTLPRISCRAEWRLQVRHALSPRACACARIQRAILFYWKKSSHSRLNIDAGAPAARENIFFNSVKNIATADPARSSSHAQGLRLFLEFCSLGRSPILHHNLVLLVTSGSRSRGVHTCDVAVSSLPRHGHVPLLGRPTV
ncbi:hypothetical protein EVAR_92514_1 [Eumeta japonica]|uniref:Uncharacterized protein n=1 Tax=Eumeta variegata TaxID=151549 RepID=A0A4C1T8V9_EUMVA|nr:hypothetical protein EVAR_92514_1 [Eumeta japonica]